MDGDMNGDDMIEEPKKGMEFNSLEDLLSYYKSYGKKCGFGVITKRTDRGEDQIARYVTLACSRDGKARNRTLSVAKRPTGKTECKAKINALRCDGKLRLTTVHNIHNHGLSPKKSRFFRRNREVSDAVKRVLDTNYIAGVRMNKSFGSLVVGTGGFENLPFLEKDCRNYIDKARHLRLGAGGAGALREYFLRMQYKNPSQSVEEFETSWDQLITTYNLHENAWLQNLYVEREHWVPTFLKDYFWVGMSTTQRSESMNAFFDRYVHAKTNLKEFVDQFDNALKKKIENENVADFHSFSVTTPCISRSLIEKRFQELYTNSKFKEVQQQVTGMIDMNPQLHNTDGAVKTYLVKDEVHLAKFTKLVTYSVNFSEEDLSAKCSCGLFQMRGILCRHILAVFRCNEIKILPDSYILDRWRKDIKRRYTLIHSSYDAGEQRADSNRYSEMLNICYQMITLAAGSREHTQDAKAKLYGMIDLYRANQEPPSMTQTGSNVGCTRGDATTVGGSEQVLSPNVVRGKGRPPSLRKASRMEKDMRKVKAKEKKTQAKGKRKEYKKGTRANSDTMEKLKDVILVSNVTNQRTFRPKKNAPSGSKVGASSCGYVGAQLQKHIDATLGSGNLREAVRLPPGEDIHEWLAVNTVDFFNQVNILFGTLTEFCTASNCPMMTAGPKYEYRWADGVTIKKPIEVSAPKYVEYLMDWIETQLDDESIFPQRLGSPFPPNFKDVVKTIFKRLFRVYAHIYHSHFQKIVNLKEEAHLNTCFKHFVLFTWEFRLIDKGELAPLSELVESILQL
ncbi:hypothetical protein EZV62_013014 [Acer yangbiense]|uniref:Protein FAR1-RELATED SEQUENCE n=1 Tax=Acer yangbiense TaxID=1000413 RepID=A0A5C7HWZ9_9ROSI|nr:hypothetical protein EZV62_013014 [Acer yangbiense]